MGEGAEAKGRRWEGTQVVDGGRSSFPAIPAVDPEGALARPGKGVFCQLEMEFAEQRAEEGLDSDGQAGRARHSSMETPDWVPL